jgi:hypothetical protein
MANAPIVYEYRPQSATVTPAAFSAALPGHRSDCSPGTACPALHIGMVVWSRRYPTAEWGELHRPNGCYRKFRSSAASIRSLDLSKARAMRS